jgi:hypothetical protein
MFQEVFFKVCYGNKNPGPRASVFYIRKMAKLHNYFCVCVKDDDRPGLTPMTGADVTGMLVTGLTAADMKKLDDFAGDRYKRQSVTVTLRKRLGTARFVDDGTTTTQAYFIKRPEDLKNEEW